MVNYEEIVKWIFFFLVLQHSTIIDEYLLKELGHSKERFQNHKPTGEAIDRKKLKIGYIS